MRQAAIMLAVLLSSVIVGALADDERRATQQAVVNQFAQLDHNGDKRLSMEEFQAVTPKNQVAVAQRDFRLFDVDASGTLTLDEFCTVPIVVPNAVQRGPLPDPMQGIVEMAVATLDKSFGDWNDKPDVEIDVRQFITAFVASMGNTAVRPIFREADPDQDQQVTREEARRFLEIQLGIRRSDGKLLREPNGRVINYMLYLYVDQNGNDKIERTEFLERSFSGPTAATEFDKSNTDGDDCLSFEEFSTRPGHGVLDPIMEFRQLDANLDARVDPQELLAGTPDWKQKMASSTFPAFDLDRDGTLSLDEYRLSMTANMVLPWQDHLDDQDGDGTLTFGEFKFDPQLQFPLLRFVNFHRLDLNGDRLLEPKEFWFKTKAPDEFFVMNADGTGWQKLFDVAEVPSLGSAAVSPDGKQLAFDGHRAKNGVDGQTILIADLDGKNLRNLGAGMMPNWNKNGTQLTYSSDGIRLMNADGTGSRQLCAGWGAQWSPDGQRIAYYDGLTIMAYDMGTETSAKLYDAAADGFEQIFWNMTWSPDSQRICFKGSRKGNEEVATVFADPQRPRMKVRYSGKSVIADFAWHPNGDRVVFCAMCAERQKFQIYEFNPDDDGVPQLLRGQDPTTANTSVCWTPDGKRLIVITGDF